MWDDHEIANDCWVAGAENHDPDKGEGDWRARKAAALKAYHKWMPIRAPRRGLDAIYRKFDFGDLATLLMTETRLLGRAEQAAFNGEAVGADAVRTVLAERDRPEREMLDATQARWLEAELAASVAGARPWRVIGNQLVMARVAGSDLETSMGKPRFDAAVAWISVRREMFSASSSIETPPLTRPTFDRERRSLLKGMSRDKLRTILGRASACGVAVHRASSATLLLASSIRIPPAAVRGRCEACPA